MVDELLKNKLVDLVKQNSKKLTYINIKNDRYAGWVTNFNVSNIKDEKIYLDLHKEEDLFLLFVLASCWSRSGFWENAAYFVIYLKLNNKCNIANWRDKDYVKQELSSRNNSITELSNLCSKIVTRKSLSFRIDFYSSVNVLADNWEDIKKNLIVSEQENNYKIIAYFLSSIKGLGYGERKMKIKIPLILRELRVQNIYKKIPGKLCCVTDKRVRAAAKKLGIVLPSCDSIKKVLKSSKIIYKHFKDLYDIPLFAYQDYFN